MQIVGDQAAAGAVIGPAAGTPMGPGGEAGEKRLPNRAIAPGAHGIAEPDTALGKAYHVGREEQHAACPGQVKEGLCLPPSQGQGFFTEHMESLLQRLPGLDRVEIRGLWGDGVF